MPKSKEFISDSDSDSDLEPKPKKKKEEKKQSVECPKPEAAKKSKGADGEVMIDLSGMKFATVSQFRGKVLVGIREYYEKDGEFRPGKKGIALNAEQWKRLKASIDEVDAAVRDIS